jgi:acyl dehydratase
VAGKDATLRSMSARFAGPVWPGDTLTVDLWHRDDTTVGFRMRGRDDKEVLTGGLASVG